MSHVKNINSSLSDLVYLTRGKDNGINAWHYVAIDKLKLPIFQQDSKNGDVDIIKYGKIIRSGWGKSPPEEVTNEIKKNYGFKTNG